MDLCQLILTIRSNAPFRTYWYNNPNISYEALTQVRILFRNTCPLCHSISYSATRELCNSSGWITWKQIQCCASFIVVNFRLDCRARCCSRSFLNKRFKAIKKFQLVYEVSEKHHIKWAIKQRRNLVTVINFVTSHKQTLMMGQQRQH